MHAVIYWYIDTSTNMSLRYDQHSIACMFEIVCKMHALQPLVCGSLITHFKPSD